ncbi:MAG TPA: GatB/YqeY domain-containing protein [Thermodesulfovibrionales bacterium]|nr:GatB/YqeY domain-containing protein [Thermodesulfovibrionales bacterium]
MSLLQTLDQDLKSAMKSSDTLRVSVLRMLKASLKYKQIDTGKELSDDEVLAVLSTAAKQRRESIEQFSKGGRTDLADKETAELNVIQSYLPQQLAPEELDRIIIEALNEAAADGKKDMGSIMRIVMPRVKGATDGKLVNQRVRDLMDQK